MKTIIPKNILNNSKVPQLDDNRKLDSEFLKIDSGGGLVLNRSDSSLVVDLKSYDQKRLNDFYWNLKIWQKLTSNKNFYVNKETGSDEIVDGVGESEDKPFKSIQACIDYVYSKFFFGSWTVTIKVSVGVYDDSLNIRNFFYCAGLLIIEGSGDIETEDCTIIGSRVIRGNIVTISHLAHVQLKNLKICLNQDEQDFSADTSLCAIVATNFSQCRLIRISIELNYIGDNNPPSIKTLRGIQASTNSVIELSEMIILKNLLARDVSNVQFTGLVASGHGDIRGQTNTIVKLRGSFNYYVLVAFEYGNFIFRSSSFVFDSDSYTAVTGKKFSLTTGSSISTSKRGENFIPGTEVGYIDSTQNAWFN